MSSIPRMYAYVRPSPRRRAHGDPRRACTPHRSGTTVTTARADAPGRAVPDSRRARRRPPSPATTPRTPVHRPRLRPNPSRCPYPARPRRPPRRRRRPGRRNSSSGVATVAFAFLATNARDTGVASVAVCVCDPGSSVSSTCVCVRLSARAQDLYSANTPSRTHTRAIYISSFPCAWAASPRPPRRSLRPPVPLHPCASPCARRGSARIHPPRPARRGRGPRVKCVCVCVCRRGSTRR